MSWTDEMFDDAQRLWGQGRSASEIAVWLSAEYRVPVSRNAVLGKLHRAGVPKRSDETNRRSMRVGGRKAARASAQARRAKSAPDVPARPTIVTLPPIKPDPADVPRKTLKDLGNDECHWPVGDPLTPSFGYCADKVMPPFDYCERHFRKMYPTAVIVSRVSDEAKERENA